MVEDSKDLLEIRPTTGIIIFIKTLFAIIIVLIIMEQEMNQTILIKSVF